MELDPSPAVGTGQQAPIRREAEKPRSGNGARQIRRIEDRYFLKGVRAPDLYFPPEGGHNELTTRGPNCVADFLCISNARCARIPRGGYPSHNSCHWGADLLIVQFLDGRRAGYELKCGMVNVGSGLTDDLEEFGHEAEAVSDGVVQSVGVGGCPDLALD